MKLCAITSLSVQASSPLAVSNWMFSRIRFDYHPLSATVQSARRRSEGKAISGAVGDFPARVEKRGESKPVDASSPLTLRIFVSSPGDVPVERARAAGVVARLQDEFKHYAVLEAVFWEDVPAKPTDTYQRQLPQASAMDVVVGILWTRIGTPLPPDMVRADGTRL